MPAVSAKFAVPAVPVVPVVHVVHVVVVQHLVSFRSSDIG
jgi:hypothetical protein